MDLSFRGLAERKRVSWSSIRHPVWFSVRILSINRHLGVRWSSVVGVWLGSIFVYSELLRPWDVMTVHD